MAVPLRVLILEDNPADAELVLHTLRRAGFDPVAHCGETEEDYRTGLADVPEIILADFSMPEFDAVRALEILRELRLDIPFIIVSGTIGEERAVQVMQLGATDFILKDRLGRLGQAVTQALEKSRARGEMRCAERRLAAQHAVTRALAESPPADVAGIEVLHAVCRSMDWDFGVLWRVDRNEAVLRCVDCWHNPAAEMGEFETATRGNFYHLGKDFPGTIWSTGRPMRIGDVSRNPSFDRAPASERCGLHAAFGFPIVLGNETLGILEFFDRKFRRPDEDEQRMMLSIGSQFGQYIERMRIGVALRQSEERYRSLISATAAIVWDAPPGGNFEPPQPGWTAFTGQTADELRGWGWLEAIHPEDRAHTARDWTAAVAARTEYVTEHRIRRADGEYRRMSVRGVPILAADGAIREWVGVHTDITERQQAEVDRDRLLSRLQLHIERMPLAYVLFDADLRIVEWNAAAERIFGYSREEMLGTGPPYALLAAPEHWAEGDELLRRIRDGDMDVHPVRRNLHRDGRTLTCHWFNTPLAEKDGTWVGFLSLVQDLTEQSSLEAQVRQSQKMEAFGQLAAGVAHDFNNLLTVISGYGEIVLGRMGPADPLREAVQAIAEAGERAAMLTRQLLAFGRKTVLEPKVLDPNAIVRDTMKLLRRLIGEDIQLTAVLDPTVPRVLVDPGLLGQVLMNLAVNARDAMPRGGKLTIETTSVYLDEDYVARHPDSKAGEYVKLAVSDNGCGMTPEIRAHIFEPFFTTKEPGKGTGLGLATVHGIVKQSGGGIELYTEPGHGTTFKIYLPAIDAPRRPAMSPASPARETKGAETILLVEDDAAVRAIALLILRMQGYAVLQADDGMQALGMVETHAGRIDLVVTDVVMPGLSGRELAESLRRRFPTIKVLYVSGYTDDAVIRHGILQRDVAFLQKPFTPRSLADKVREVLSAIA